MFVARPTPARCRRVESAEDRLLEAEFLERSLDHPVDLRSEILEGHDVAQPSHALADPCCFVGNGQPELRGTPDQAQPDPFDAAFDGRVVDVVQDDLVTDVRGRPARCRRPSSRHRPRRSLRRSSDQGSSLAPPSRLEVRSPRQSLRAARSPSCRIVVARPLGRGASVSGRPKRPFHARFHRPVAAGQGFQPPKGRPATERQGRRMGVTVAIPATTSTSRGSADAPVGTMSDSPVTDRGIPAAASR